MHIRVQVLTHIHVQVLAYLMGEERDSVYGIFLERIKKHLF